MVQIFLKPHEGYFSFTTTTCGSEELRPVTYDSDRLTRESPFRGLVAKSLFSKDECPLLAKWGHCRQLRPQALEQLFPWIPGGPELGWSLSSCHGGWGWGAGRWSAAYCQSHHMMLSSKSKRHDLYKFNLLMEIHLIQTQNYLNEWDSLSWFV